jgi:c-di-GMP-related signal transduction protein
MRDGQRDDTGDCSRAGRVEAEQLVADISSDVTLSYKLLRYINSVSSTINSRTLIAKALERANMCELLAGASGTEEAVHYQFFTAALFSVLDALMDSPLDEVLRELPLSAPPELP